MITPHYTYTISDAGQCEIRDSTAFTGPGSEDGDLVLILHGRWNTEEFAQQVCNALAVDFDDVGAIFRAAGCAYDHAPV